MFDLSIIAAGLAHDRVAEQFAGPATTRRVPVRRAAVRILRRTEQV